jgi:sugar O-acyltransferase (sialic acid O-acetyltransferase NeuD family)
VIGGPDGSSQMTRWISLPKLGTNMESAVVLEWLKAEGDHVELGTPLVEVETDKADFTIEAEGAGTLTALQVQQGDRVGVNEVLAAIVEEGESRADIVPPPRDEPTGADYLERVRSAWKRPASDAHERRSLAMAPAARTIARDAGLSPEALRWAGSDDRLLGVDETSRLVDLPRAVIYGAGLGGKQILEVLRSRPAFVPVAFVDDDERLVGTQLGGLPVLGEKEGLRDKLVASEIGAVFLSFHSEVRRRVYRRLRDQRVPMPPLVDARAAVGHDVELADGCLVEAGAVLGPGSKLGEAVIVDVGSVVAHDCRIGDHCHLSPGACLSGVVQLEDNVLIGVGASVNSTVRVGSNSIVAPGSAVMNDLPSDVVAMGVPAVVVGESKRGSA